MKLKFVRFRDAVRAPWDGLEVGSLRATEKITIEQSGQWIRCACPAKAAAVQVPASNIVYVEEEAADPPPAPAKK